MDFFFEPAFEISELSRLLGMTFAPGHRSQSSVPGRRIQRLLALEGQGNWLSRDWEFARLRLLVKNLSEIEKERPEILRVFRREIRRAKKDDSFLGIRFEISIAASLIRKRILFTKGEAPDFTLLGPPEETYIECGSGHIRGAYHLSLMDKAKRILAEKSAKPYSHSRTALFLDVTNVVAVTRTVEQIPAGRGWLRETATELSKLGTFGSILLFCYMPNPQLHRYESNYVRADRDDASPFLLFRLDAMFPKGHHEVATPLMPLEG